MGLNDSFKSACRVLFGREIGELGQFVPYLQEMVDAPVQVPSSVSGEPIYLSRPYYSKDAIFFDMAEPARPQKALNPGDLADLDSLLSAAHERFTYSGNKNLGISQNISESDSCNDSSDILRSQNVIASRRVAYSNGVRQSDFIFGGQLNGEAEFSMRCQLLYFSKRCFETYLSEKCSDMYFSFNCRGCTDCLFCFCQSGKRNCIGNVELPREKYVLLKRRLLGEVAEKLAEEKRFPSLFELASQGETNGG